MSSKKGSMEVVGPVNPSQRKDSLNARDRQSPKERLRDPSSPARPSVGKDGPQDAAEGGAAPTQAKPAKEGEAKPSASPNPAGEVVAATYPDAQLCSIAETLGLRSPKTGDWLSQFGFLVEQMPHAIVLSDASPGGMSVLLCNSAAVRLTGYSMEEYMGSHTSMLQCKQTEAAAVRMMRRGIREGVQTTLYVTNKKKDGTIFRNVLTLHPVKDDSSAPCFWIGLLAENANHDAEGERLKQLRALLPVEWTDTSKRAREADELDNMTWKDNMMKFSKLLWSTNWETSLLQLAQHPSSKSAFGQWLREVAPAELEQLELCIHVSKLEDLPSADAAAQALEMAKKYLDGSVTNGEQALTDLRAMSKQVLGPLAEKRFAKYVSSKGSKSTVEKLLASSKKNIDLVSSLLWSKYEVPKDAGPWLRAFISASETYPVCVAVSDESAPGHILIYVNKQFCKVTGYSREEAHGRSARFLQGPRTERQCLAMIDKTLKKGTDSQVRLTNYCKKGRVFQNLLTLRPVHDSNGAYRYVVALWIDVTDETALETKSSRMIKLIKLLPAPLDVPKPTEEDSEEGMLSPHATWWKQPLIKITRKLWTTDYEHTLRNVMHDPIACKMFRQWLKKAAPDDVLQLDICREASNLANLPRPQAIRQAMVMCEQYLAEHGGGAHALKSITDYSEQAMQVLAERRFVKFAASAAGDDAITKLLERSPEALGGVLWSKYNVPEDCAIWVHAFISLSETFPHAIGLSDVTVPGNPMVYVNREFCRVTGYDAEEVHGRNCRFLQGEKTEHAAINKIREAFAQEVTCQVKILNYNKDGSVFDNLLTIRPLSDTKGKPRFLISVQVDVTQEIMSGVTAHASRVAKLLKMLPKNLMAPKVAPVVTSGGEIQAKVEDASSSAPAPAAGENAGE